MNCQKNLLLLLLPLGSSYIHATVHVILYMHGVLNILAPTSNSSSSRSSSFNRKKKKKKKKKTEERPLREFKLLSRPEHTDNRTACTRRSIHTDEGTSFFSLSLLSLLFLILCPAAAATERETTWHFSSDTREK